ncbi:ski oncogene-like [Notothenia coriiceps]|uniref:Ski oncogene-like n=1 Tax=Notothenia coriiceps TaxID=8208 RepID=A0A6I9NHU6_9TELE|nr:PREDICTED: ski oncogene-like [Notothenia coriiceps]
MSRSNYLKLKSNVFLFLQASDPVPIKRSKHEDFPSPALQSDKEKQHDWLQSLSAANKGLNCIQPRQRPSAFRPWSPHISAGEKEPSSHPLALLRDSFYNYKSIEKAVAPNVALTPLPLGKVGPMSLSVPSTSHPSGSEPPGEGASSRPRKRRATEELQPPEPEPPCPPPAAASKPPLPPTQDDKESEVEIEVESRDECKQTT